MLEYWIRERWDGGRPADGAEIKLTISSAKEGRDGVDEDVCNEAGEEMGSNNKVTDDEDNNGGLMVHVDAPFYDDPRVPPNIPQGSTDRLWEYEVVELFFLATDNKYLEIELAPRGHYLLLQLDGHPQNRLQYQLPLRTYRSQVIGNRWLGQAIIPYNYLPAGSARFNAYAIHKSEPARQYMALYPVPRNKYAEPNFHRLDYFQPIDLSPFLS